MALGQVDPRIVKLAQASANFGFLLNHLDLLVLYGAGAEAAIFTDPNVALVKARQFGEALSGDLVRRFRLHPPGGRQVDRLHELERAGVLHGQVRPAFDRIRVFGNRAVHNGYAEQRAAFEAVKTCFQLGVWFDRLLTGTREPRAWVPPTRPLQEEPTTAGERAALAQLNEDYQRALDELAENKLRYRDAVSAVEAQRLARAQMEEALAAAQAEQARLTATLAALTDVQSQTVEQALNMRQPVTPNSVQRDVWLGNAQEAAREPLSEAQVRVELDRMLVEAGWSVQDNSAKTLNLHANQGVAVREMTVGKGRADYLLYVDQMLVGVIEAKREGEDLAKAEDQADAYVTNLKSAQKMAAWRQGELPFRYVSDGGRTKFRNTLDPESRSRRVFSFHRPETLGLWIRKAEEDPQAPTLRAKMRFRMPILDESELRPAQIEAVTGIERSHAMGKQRSLIQMATGAGKTYTAVTFSHRLAKYADARKILFLVDRNNLGAQAKGEFDNYQIPGTNRAFPEEYNVQRLATGQEMADSTKVVVSTIQRLWMTLTGQALPPLEEDSDALDDYETDRQIEVRYNREFPPETFDMIIIDECHRSIYGKWRQVLEYFDAHLVGLTATPVAQTFGFFEGNLVAEYTYEQAVADGVNVPFEVYRIRTEVTENGATIPSGIVVPKVDRRTRRQKYEELEDDFTYRAAQVGSSVMTKDQIRTVIRTFRDNLYTGIFPDRANIPETERMVPKTLIFAQNDQHADDIVEIVRTEFGRGNAFCKKITHKAVKAHDLINDFRTSAELRIAVTVDMIATGTDVKPLECLFFLRDVRSWAYFEQMKGRGSRTLKRAELQQVSPDVEAKTHFVIVDAIGVTENPKVDASPMDKDATRRLSLEKLLRNVGNNTISPDEVSTLAARLAKLNQQIKPEERAELERLAGRPITAITRAMVDAVSVDAQEKAKASGGKNAVWDLARTAVAPLAANPDLRNRILEIRRAADIVYDEVTVDKVLHAGAVVMSKEDAQAQVKSFREYMQQHRDEITAFHIAYKNPEVTPREVFSQLKELARRLERPPQRWTPEGLWRAYEALDIASAKRGVRHGVADLISIIRFELGEDTGLRPYSELVAERFSGWMLRQEQAGVVFTDAQRWWLEQIAESIARNVRFDEASLDSAPFTQNGGTGGYLRDFGEDAAVHYLHELNRELAA
ncbi:DEAD/DEAH box helicase family protein [Streptomyces sp. BRB081]|uniref:DEAD/DEAH box helicase family protein n=1 Tax=Streptomyces sp. BRB081 TaxID=2769544 RepID=UPI0027DB4985|nr:DEAD/DEAH box helicase family protein [Streptomyces sp. BRB081]